MSQPIAPSIDMSAFNVVQRTGFGRSVLEGRGSIEKEEAIGTTMLFKWRNTTHVIYLSSIVRDDERLRVSGYLPRMRCHIPRARDCKVASQLAMLSETRDVRAPDLEPSMGLNLV